MRGSRVVAYIVMSLLRSSRCRPRWRRPAARGTRAPRQEGQERPRSLQAAQRRPRARRHDPAGRQRGRSGRGAAAGARRGPGRQPHHRQAVQVRRRPRQGRGLAATTARAPSRTRSASARTSSRTASRWTPEVHEVGRGRTGRVDHRLHEPRPRVRRDRRDAARHERGGRPRRPARPALAPGAALDARLQGASLRRPG